MLQRQRYQANQDFYQPSLDPCLIVGSSHTTRYQGVMLAYGMRSPPHFLMCPYALRAEDYIPPKHLAARTRSPQTVDRWAVPSAVYLQHLTGYRVAKPAFQRNQDITLILHETVHLVKEYFAIIQR